MSFPFQFGGRVGKVKSSVTPVWTREWPTKSQKLMTGEKERCRIINSI